MDEYTDKKTYNKVIKERATTQKLFLIESVKVEEKEQYTVRKYVIMGSTGNVYLVTIKDTPTCDCPHFTTKHVRCKHIYFVLLKIMKVDTNSTDKNKFTDKDLVKMFNSIPEITNNLLVDQTHKNKYIRSKDNKLIQQKLDQEDLCPVCLDDLGDDMSLLDYCKYSCGKTIHIECYKMWTKSKNKECVYCRASWDKQITKDSKYVNLN